MRISDWSSDVCSSDLDGPLHRALGDVARVRGGEAIVVHREERALLESPLSPDDYWDAAVRAKKRKELRRQANRLAEQGAVGFRRWRTGEALNPGIAAFLALEARGRAEERRVGKECGRTGGLRLAPCS